MLIKKVPEKQSPTDSIVYGGMIVLALYEYNFHHFTTALSCIRNSRINSRSVSISRLEQVLCTWELIHIGLYHSNRRSSPSSSPAAKFLCARHAACTNAVLDQTEFVRDLLDKERFSMKGSNSKSSSMVARLSNVNAGELEAE